MFRRMSENNWENLSELSRDLNLRGNQTPLHAIAILNYFITKIRKETHLMGCFIDDAADMQLESLWKK